MNAHSSENTSTGRPRESTIFDASLRALTHRKSSSPTMPQLKLVEFAVELPAAQTVQLVADFTDWDEFPLDMTRFENGVWSTTVPLPTGIYAYQFLADGERFDDPKAVRRKESSFGAGKAFVRVR